MKSFVVFVFAISLGACWLPGQDDATVVEEIIVRINNNIVTRADLNGPVTNC